MEKYFISKGLKKIGPLSLEQLLLHKPNAKTLIWKEGNDNWESAENFPELKLESNLIPPSRFVKAKPNSIKIALLLSLMFSLIVFLIASNEAITAIIFKIEHNDELKSTNADSELEHFFIVNRWNPEFIVMHDNPNTVYLDKYYRRQHIQIVDVNKTLDKTIYDSIIKAIPITILCLICCFTIFCLPFQTYIQNLKKVFQSQ